jgi:hypothetical protein
MGSDGQRVGFDVTIPIKKGQSSWVIYRYKAGRGRYVAAKLNCCPFCRVAFDDDEPRRAANRLANGDVNGANPVRVHPEESNDRRSKNR